MKRSMRIGTKITVISCLVAVIAAIMLAVVTTVVFMSFVGALQEKEIRRIILKKQNTKIVVIPHYSGSQKPSEVFKRVITDQIEKKLNKNENKPNNAAN